MGIRFRLSNRSGSRVRIQAVLVLLVLVIQYASTIPIPVNAVDEPLIDITSPQSFSKKYVRDPGFGKTDNNSTLTITLYPNSTLLVSEDNAKRFVFALPTVIAQNLNKIARVNSTYYVTGYEGAGNYLYFRFLLGGSNNDRFKFSACWQLPQSSSLDIPMSSINASRLANNIFYLNSGLKVDWNDAVAQGFSVTKFTDPQGNIYARVSVQASGCFDPSIVASSTARDALTNAGSSHTEYVLSRWWVFYWDGSNLGYRASAVGGGTTWSSFTSLIACSPDCYSGMQWNGTHFHVVIRDNHASANPQYRQCTPNSNATLTCGSVYDFASGLSAGGISEIAVRGDGIPFGLTRSACCTPHTVSLYQSNNHLGSSWTSRGDVYSDSTSFGVLTTVNLLDDRIMIIGGGNSLISRIFYKSNSSFGTLTTISSSSSQGAAKAVSDKNGAVHLTYRDGSTSNVYYTRYSGGSWSAPRLITASAVAGISNVGVTINKAQDGVTLFHYQTNKIVWNATDSSFNMVGSGTELISGQSGFDYLSSSDYANSTGFVGLMWKNGTSTYNALFHAFYPRPPAQGGAMVGRSTTGSCPTGQNCPKYHEWNTTTLSWGPEVELATAGSPVRFAQLSFSPISARRVIVTLSGDGYLDTYACSYNCTISANWNVTNDLARVWTSGPSGAQRPYDVAFEKTSGNLLLVYDKVSTSSSQDLFYRTLGESNVTWSLERSFNDPTSSLTDTVYSFVRLATNWTATSDKIGVMALDESGVDALAWIWNGSNSTVSNFIELTASASIGTQEVMGLAFESSSGNLMIVAGEGNDMRYARFTTSWQTSALFGTWAVGNIRWVTIKANPVSTSNEIFVAASGGLSDLDSAYWSGSAWTNHSEHDSDIDSSTTRVFDYSWNGLNSSGILIWGTTSGSLSYKRFTASNTFSSTGTFSESGTHPWVVLNNPNPSTSDPILVFGATIDSNNQVGGLKWGGGSTPPQSTGDGGAGAPGSTQFLSLSVAWQKEMGPWGTDIPVDITGNHTREVHLATSPTSNTLVAAYITQLIPTPELRCEVRPSFNGGLKWGRSTAMANFSGLPSSLQADPVVAAKSSGEFTLMCLEVVLSDSSRIFTSTSSDGLIWSTTQQAAIATYPVELDKPWMVIDNNSSSPYKDNVYACWTRNNGTSPGSSSEIVFKRLGPTSLPEKVLYKSPLVTRTQLGCNMAIGTNGEIYITWLDILDKSSGIIKFRWNTLGGEEWGWGRLQNISSVNRFRFLNIAQINGQAALIKAGNDPSIAVDLLGGVHVVYAENSTQTKSGGDIKYVNSNDCRKGSKVDRCSWSSPLTISIGISGVLVWQDQWEPAIHISNDGPKFPSGVVHVTALDRRNDPLNIKWHVWEYYCAPGITLGCRNTRDWVYRPVSDVAMHNEGLKEVGDYHAVTSTKSGKVYTAWTDTRKYILNNFDIMGDWTKR